MRPTSLGSAASKRAHEIRAGSIYKAKERCVEPWRALGAVQSSRRHNRTSSPLKWPTACFNAVSLSSRSSIATTRTFSGPSYSKKGEGAMRLMSGVKAAAATPLAASNRPQPAGDRACTASWLAFAPATAARPQSWSVDKH